MMQRAIIQPLDAQAETPQPVTEAAELPGQLIFE